MRGKGVDETEILFADNHLLAVNKPPGLLTQPTEMAADSLELRAKAWIKETKDKPGEVFLHALHRLDKATSGVVLFARTGKALTRMNEEMRQKHIIKIYHAVITEDLPAEQGTLMHHLRHSRMRSEVVSAGEPGALASLLAYRVVGRTGGLVLVEIVLDTGRYHQIRAQLAACGCPVLGDIRYGGSAMSGGETIALHHCRMEFTHPTLKSHVRIEAPYPKGWPFSP